MNIGELFVNIGIKGTEKTIQALGNVKSGLGAVASTSLEVKAAIIGAIYALERLISTSADMGMSLANFKILFGNSTKELQQFQNAGREVGLTFEETASKYSPDS